MAEAIDYKVVLADLKARRDALDAAIAAIEPLASGDASLPGALIPSGAPGTDPIRPGSFHLMSVPEATIKYLGMTGEVPKTPVEIADALNRGGQGKANYSNVYTALKRLRGAGAVTKLPNGTWGLKAWFLKEGEST